MIVLINTFSGIIYDNRHCRYTRAHQRAYNSSFRATIQVHGGERRGREVFHSACFCLLVTPFSYQTQQLDRI